MSNDALDWGNVSTNEEIYLSSECRLRRSLKLKAETIAYEKAILNEIRFLKGLLVYDISDAAREEIKNRINELKILINSRYGRV